MSIIIEPLCGDVQNCPRTAKVRGFFFSFLVKICYQKEFTKWIIFPILGAYTTHQMVVKMALTSYDQIPEKLAENCFVEYTMPQTTVSHTTIRSVSVQDSDSDDPPEKYVRYLARYEYTYVSTLFLFHEFYCLNHI